MVLGEEARLFVVPREEAEHEHGTEGHCDEAGGVRALVPLQESSLRPGDDVRLRRTWIARRRVGGASLADSNSLTPVTIKLGAPKHHQLHQRCERAQRQHESEHHAQARARPTAIAEAAAQHAWISRPPISLSQTSAGAQKRLARSRSLSHRMTTVSYPSTPERGAVPCDRARLPMAAAYEWAAEPGAAGSRAETT